MVNVKQVTVQMVYRFKEVARICFVVESSAGDTTYNTCFNGDAQHGSCTCDGYEKYHRDCYHLKSLRPQAQAYFDAREPVAQVAEVISEQKMNEMAAYYEKDMLAAQFGTQVHKMERAASGRLVPMR